MLISYNASDIPSADTLRIGLRYSPRGCGCLPLGTIGVYSWGTLRSTPGERDGLPQGEALVYPKSVF